MSAAKKSVPEIAEDDFLFLPLGGSDEIGMNLNLYHYGGKWLMVDLGISFGDDTMPGIDILLPDPEFIEQRRHDLVGLVVTHGHEDHIGAIPYLWPKLRCPIYATPFTATLVRRKLADEGILEQVELIEIDLSANFVIGPFEIELITLTHSIPEPNALVIRCGGGTVLHSGDWKFDPEPVIGEASDIGALRAVGDEGVLAMIGDSTNVLDPGRSGSEASLTDSLAELFRKHGTHRIAITCFASNVGRLKTISEAAEAAGRHVALVGRSLWKMYEAALQNGYLRDIPEFVSEKDAGFIPRDKLVLICTGSQGEPRAALARIADNAHPEITLERGDVVIFSSREIPGNEAAIGRIQSKLVARGIEVVTEREHHVHVSGHPAREELVEMYQFIRPRIAVPVHGSPRHLEAHARLARECQVPEAIVPGNGSLIRLKEGAAEIVGWVPTGAFTMDGGRLRPIESSVLGDRKKMLFNGAVSATVLLNGKDQLHGDPVLTFNGIADEGEIDALSESAKDLIWEAVGALGKKARANDDEVGEAVRRAVRRVVRSEYGKRPVTTVHVLRI
ncbi:ribonuclease J [Nisaea acidiphila]|uniref:Ribonuclease J n=1 Tax=Nisaea acidiphila TaxID=1862145 RepID=A0A9J7AUV2_9PROT|nr:ribonuclease J [Nisaea acidiphila]UUX50241.1 ribonuclease J [Nisaea acidiphila]